MLLLTDIPDVGSSRDIDGRTPEYGRTIRRGDFSSIRPRGEVDACDATSLELDLGLCVLDHRIFGGIGVRGRPPCRVTVWQVFAITGSELVIYS